MRKITLVDFVIRFENEIAAQARFAKNFKNNECELTFNNLDKIFAGPCARVNFIVNMFYLNNEIESLVKNRCNEHESHYIKEKLYNMKKEVHLKLISQIIDIVMKSGVQY